MTPRNILDGFVSFCYALVGVMIFAFRGNEPFIHWYEWLFGIICFGASLFMFMYNGKQE